MTQQPNLNRSMVNSLIEDIKFRFTPHLFRSQRCKKYLIIEITSKSEDHYIHIDSNSSESYSSD
ncbi:hypothetical protein WICANDRAFT_85141 [Wickerhamomyces anomalus NRRL Y-366-8]|uniref:Uncharacterized protein n=1 Tax=Wickerhamomyces anomalus (strain ATCC 58044 / CBS 1984 / NCYC 433 / NRRL Y-366-8) TaxID=683960 RepID=A0A1E3NY49_WICAA|nr:uncharacterized protein WICANDRAFT_85141 [Wickerhamomyces anomalus NRRL Y-366-8]ODQ57984.1 hypothetical protein WICANDRAFT_85141 [Wickerhamomyces anomalus NRRL Y-366-8]